MTICVLATLTLCIRIAVVVVIRHTEEITFISVTPNISSESGRPNCCPVKFILFASDFETVQCFACEFWTAYNGPAASTLDSNCGFSVHDPDAGGINATDERFVADGATVRRYFVIRLFQNRAESVDDD